jgi:integrase
MTRRKNERNEVIDDFLNTKSEGTQKAYRSHLTNYFEAIGKDPTTYINKDVRRISRDEELDLKDSIETDLKLYSKTIKNEPPKTQHPRLMAIKGFLEHNYIEFPKRVWRDIDNCKSVAITEKRTLQPDGLRKILQPADELEKAFFMIKATSGVRIEELAQLTFDDAKDRIISLRHTITKNGKPRFTIFTEEAQEFLDAYLTKRKQYMIEGFKKSKMARNCFQKEGYEFEYRGRKEWHIFKDGKEITVDDFCNNFTRIFPFSSYVMRTKWYRLLERAGPPYNEKDKTTNRYMYNVHGLKRFCKARLRTTNMKEGWINFITAHDSLLNQTYSDDNLFKEHVKKEYDKYSGVLSIFSDKHLIDTEYKPKLERLDTNVEALLTENLRLKRQVDTLEKQIKDKEYEEQINSENEEALDNRVNELESQITRLTNLMAGLPMDYKQ